MRGWVACDDRLGGRVAMRTAIDDLDEMGGWGVVASRFRPAQVPFGTRRGSILHPSPPCVGGEGCGIRSYSATFIARDGGWSGEEDGGGWLWQEEWEVPNLQHSCILIQRMTTQRVD